jgi:hypothetical protein
MFFFLPVELRMPNSGHEPFPAFVRRQRVPRDGRTNDEFSDGRFEEYTAGMDER